MTRAVLGLFAVALVSGCASAAMVPYHVESTPPGVQIDVNGVSMGTAPTTIQLQCSKRWVGLVNAPGGWSYDTSIYTVVAYPTKENPGTSQSKQVNACEIKQPPGHLHFELGLDTVKPGERIDVNVHQDSKSTSLDDTIRALKKLRDQGILSEQEYQKKVDKAVRDAQ